MIVFDLLLKPPDLLGVAEPSGDGAAVLFTGEQRIGTGEDGGKASRTAELVELMDDGAAAHLLERADVPEQLGAGLTELGKSRHGASYVVYILHYHPKSSLSIALCPYPKLYNGQGLTALVTGQKKASPTRTLYASGDKTTF
jgi:hypothetical protein